MRLATLLLVALVCAPAAFAQSAPGVVPTPTLVAPPVAGGLAAGTFFVPPAQPFGAPPPLVAGTNVVGTAFRGPSLPTLPDLPLSAGHGQSMTAEALQVQKRFVGDPAHGAFTDAIVRPTTGLSAGLQGFHGAQFDPRFMTLETQHILSAEALNTTMQAARVVGTAAMAQRKLIDGARGYSYQTGAVVEGHFVRDDLGALRRTTALAAGVGHLGVAGVLAFAPTEEATAIFDAQRALMAGTQAKNLLAPVGPAAPVTLGARAAAVVAPQNLLNMAVTGGLVAGLAGESRGFQVLGGALAASQAITAAKSGPVLGRVAAAAMAVRGVGIAMGGNSTQARAIMENTVPVWVAASVHQANLDSFKAAREYVRYSRDVRTYQALRAAAQSGNPEAVRVYRRVSQFVHYAKDPGSRLPWVRAAKDSVGKLRNAVTLSNAINPGVFTRTHEALQSALQSTLQRSAKLPGVEKALSAVAAYDQRAIAAQADRVAAAVARAQDAKPASRLLAQALSPSPWTLAREGVAKAVGDASAAVRDSVAKAAQHIPGVPQAQAYLAERAAARVAAQNAALLAAELAPKGPGLGARVAARFQAAKQAVLDTAATKALQGTTLGVEWAGRQAAKQVTASVVAQRAGRYTEAVAMRHEVAKRLVEARALASNKGAVVTKEGAAARQFLESYKYGRIKGAATTAGEGFRVRQIAEAMDHTGKLPGKQFVSSRLLAAAGGPLGIAFRGHAAYVAAGETATWWNQLKNGKWDGKQGVRTGKAALDVVLGGAGMTDMTIHAGKLVAGGVKNTAQFAKECTGTDMEACGRKIKAAKDWTVKAGANTARFVGKASQDLMASASKCADDMGACGKRVGDASKRAVAATAKAAGKAADWTKDKASKITNAVSKGVSSCLDKGLRACTTDDKGRGLGQRAVEGTAQFGRDALAVAATLQKHALAPAAERVGSAVSGAWNKLWGN